jgi:hypothetical protein
MSKEKGVVKSILNPQTFYIDGAPSALRRKQAAQFIISVQLCGSESGKSDMFPVKLQRLGIIDAERPNLNKLPYLI